MKNAVAWKSLAGHEYRSWVEMYAENVISNYVLLQKKTRFSRLRKKLFFYNYYFYLVYIDIIRILNNNSLLTSLNFFTFLMLCFDILLWYSFEFIKNFIAMK